MERELAGRIVVSGSCEAEALVLDEPLSFWGGMDAATGIIVDRSHPQREASVRGRVLVMPGTRGSTSAAGVLVESIRSGAGPAAVLLARSDLLVVVAAFVVAELYGKHVAVVVLEPEAYGSLHTGDSVRIDESGAYLRV